MSKKRRKKTVEPLKLERLVMCGKHQTATPVTVGPDGFRALPEAAQVCPLCIAQRVSEQAALTRMDEARAKALAIDKDAYGEPVVKARLFTPRKRLSRWRRFLLRIATA